MRSDYKTWHGQKRKFKTLTDMIAAHGDSDECLVWPFRRVVGKHPYGTVYFQKQQWRVHRLSFKFTNGRIYRDLEVLHSCDNPPCFNPKHLRQGTQVDNLRDMDSRGRRVTNGRPGIPRGPNPLLQGDNHGNSKLKTEDILAIRKRWSLGDTQTAIAKDYGVSQPLIGYIVRREIWQHLPVESD